MDEVRVDEVNTCFFVDSVFQAAVTDVCRGRERLFQNKGPGLGEGRSS